MYDYQEVEHTADKRLYVEADSLTQLYIGCVMGMADIMHGQAGKAQKEMSTLTVDASGIDPETIIVELLNEVLWDFEETGELPVLASEYADKTRYPEDGESDWGVTLTFSTAKVPVIGAAIKAATFNDINAVKQNGLWSVYVTLDV